MGIEVPERATWLRMALAELNRVLNHLMFLGSYPLEIGAITPMFYAFRERETLQAVMEEVSGGRIHYMFNRVGGLKEEVPAGWTARAREAIDAGPQADARPRPADPQERHLPGPDGRRRRPDRRAGRRVRRVRAGGAGQRPRHRPAPRRAVPGVRPARRAGGDPDGRRLPLPLRGAAGPGVRVAGPGRGVPGPGGSDQRPGERAPAEGGQGAGGPHVRVDREPARHQRLLPGVTRREDTMAAQAAHSVVRERAGAGDADPRAAWSPT